MEEQPVVVQVALVGELGVAQLLLQLRELRFGGAQPLRLGGTLALRRERLALFPQGLPGGALRELHRPDLVAVLGGGGLGLAHGLLGAFGGARAQLALLRRPVRGLRGGVLQGALLFARRDRAARLLLGGLAGPHGGGELALERGVLHGESRGDRLSLRLLVLVICLVTRLLLLPHSSIEPAGWE
eukprot:PRCOL_00006000-RA